VKWRVALVRWELKLQLRSARARVGIGVYLAVCTLALVLVFLAGRDGSPYAPSLYLWQLLKVQPFLSVVLATMIAGARASGPARQHIWPVLAGASISDSGYLFGRWLAFQVLLLPVAAVPLVLAGTMSILAGSPWPEPSFWLGASWLGLWAAHVVVVMMMVSAGWLAAVTLTGSEGFALSLCLVILPLLTTILNRLLFNLHLKVMSVSVLKTFLLFGQWLEEVTHQIPGNLFASEAPVDSRAILEWLVPQVTYSLAVTVFAAGLATLYVRRTRRDLRPWSVPEDHVLRTVLLGMARLRERLVPGAALSRGDLLAATLGVVALVAGIGFSLQRQAHFQHLAEDRYAAETRAAVEPLAADIVPVTWRVQAALRRDGALTVQFRETFLNRGEGPHDHFAFSLDEQMELGDAELDLDLDATESDDLELDLDADLDLDLDGDLELDDDILNETVQLDEAGDGDDLGLDLSDDDDALELDLGDDDVIELDLGDDDDDALDLSDELDLSTDDDDALGLDLDDDGAIELDLDADDDDALDLSDELDLTTDDDDALELDLDGDDDFELDLDDDAGDLEEDAGSKLDLARAYIEMGDNEGARTLLEEVIGSGTDAETGEANELLAKLD
jgi:FimV-like protein